MSQVNQSAADLRATTGLGMEELIAAGDIDEPVTQGTFLELSNLVARLKACRETKGLSLREVSARSGLDHSFLLRLEQGWNNNPPLDSLFRYALTLDRSIVMGIEEIESADESPE